MLSDASMPASAFLDGNLHPAGREPEGDTDALTVLGLPLQVGVPRDPAPKGPAIVSGQAEVENSVIGPPYGMAVSPDGRLAYVLRTRGNPPHDVGHVSNVFTDLPQEAVVTVVDIARPEQPRVLQAVEVGRAAHSLSLSPDGSLLAVNTDEPGRNIVLRRIQAGGEVGPEVLSSEGADAGTGVRRVGRIEWHPSGRFLALGIPFENELRFFEVLRQGQDVSIRAWGTPVEVGKFPDEGTFTPDGHYYLTTDLQWGDDVPGLFVDPPPGTITAVRFDAEGGRHIVTGRAPTDISPEGIAVSPDGRHVVTGNLTDSWLPWDDRRMRPEGSLNLLQLDPSSGELRTLQQLPIAGILPEGVTFDATGDHLAVTVFDRYDPRFRRGALEIYQLTGEHLCTRLIRTNTELQLPAGPHSLLLTE